MDYKMANGVLIPNKPIIIKIYPMRKWIWKCPVCGFTSKKRLPHCRAAAGCRDHLKRFHKNCKKEPILIKKDIYNKK
jgi:hypothetical protein